MSGRIPGDEHCDGDCGMCKTSVIRSYDEKEYERIVIGDSITDLAAAKLADFTIARDFLLEQCRKQGLNHQPFDTFYDVIVILSHHRGNGGANNLTRLEHPERIRVEMEKVEEAFDELRKVKELFARRGWFPATSGNLSVRVDVQEGEPDLIAITASGKDKTVHTPEDFLLVDGRENRRFRPGSNLRPRLWFTRLFIKK